MLQPVNCDAQMMTNVTPVSAIAMPSASTLLEVSTVNAKKVKVYWDIFTNRECHFCGKLQRVPTKNQKMIMGLSTMY